MLGAPKRACAGSEGVRIRSACALSAASGSGDERNADDARGLDEPRLTGLGGEGEHPPLALGRACFLERATRERRDRLACDAGAAADADGDDSTEACRLMA